MVSGDKNAERSFVALGESATYRVLRTPRSPNGFRILLTTKIAFSSERLEESERRDSPRTVTRRRRRLVSPNARLVGRAFYEVSGLGAD